MQHIDPVNQTDSAGKSVDQVFKQAGNDGKYHGSKAPGHAQKSTSWTDDRSQASKQPAPNCL